MVFEQSAIVRVQRAALSQFSHCRIVQQIVGDQSFGLMHINGLKVLTESWVLPERAEAAELEKGRVGAAQEQKVRSLGTPKGNLGKVRRETRDNHAQVGRCKRVCLHPLNEFSARRKLPADGSVILIREKRGDSGDPRVRGLGNDQIVLLARSK